MTQIEILKYAISDFNLMGALNIFYEIGIKADSGDLKYFSTGVRLDVAGDYLKSTSRSMNGDGLVYEFFRITGVSRVSLNIFNGEVDNISNIRKKHRGQLLIYDAHEVGYEKEVS